MRLVFKSAGREYWTRFDHSARVFELYSSREGADWLGAFNTIGQAQRAAVRHNNAARIAADPSILITARTAEDL